VHELAEPVQRRELREGEQIRRELASLDAPGIVYIIMISV